MKRLFKLSMLCLPLLTTIGCGTARQKLEAVDRTSHRTDNVTVEDADAPSAGDGKSFTFHDGTTDECQVHPWGPRAQAIASPTYVAAGDTVFFNGSSSSDVGISSYSWWFGDGESAYYSSTPWHEYASPGEYRAVYHVVDKCGRSDSDYVYIRVTDGQPSARFHLLSGKVSLQSTAKVHIASGHRARSFTINWGDGGSTALSGGYNFSVAGPVEHRYAVPGTYTVEVEAANYDGYANLSKSVVVVDGPVSPTLILKNAAAVIKSEGTTRVIRPVFAVADDDKIAGLVIHWGDNGADDRSYDMAAIRKLASTTSVEGDEAIYTQLSLKHTYPKDGNYTVTTTALDQDGTQTTIFTTFKTKNYKPELPPVSVTKNIGKSRALRLSFDPTKAKDKDGDPTTISYAMSLVDVNGQAVCPQAPGITSFDCQFPADGKYVFTLTGTDELGASTTTTLNLKVANALPSTPTFTSKRNKNVPGQYTFTVKTKGLKDTDGVLVDSPLWSVVDAGGVAVAGCDGTINAVLSCTFPTAGTYTVIASVKDDLGAASASVKTIKVTATRTPVN